MSDYQDTLLVKNPAFAWRRVADELILVPIRGHARDLSYVYSLNDTAALIWELIDGRHGRAEICRALEREFDVEPEEAAADLAAFLDELTSIGAVQEAPR
jgi:hypothetical protein